MPIAGQCKVDPVTGLSGDIYTQWLADGDAGFGTNLPNLQSSGSVDRRLIGAQIEAIAAAIIAGGGPGVPSPILFVVSAKAAAFSAAVGNHYRCTGGTYAATIPLGALTIGETISVKNISATLVTVTCSGGDLIDGSSATLPLVAGEDALLVAHSTGWDLI